MGDTDVKTGYNSFGHMISPVLSSSVAILNRFQNSIQLLISPVVPCLGSKFKDGL